MVQAKAITKIKKKHWYPLIAPSIFRNAVLGETTVYDENAMMGKTVTQNLMSLTGDIKKQNTNIEFIVTKVDNGKAFTDIIGYYLIPASIKRLTRRRSEKIELSFTCETSDGKHIRIKPLIFAISNTKSSVRHHIRRSVTDFLVRTIKKMTYNDLIKDLIDFKIQKTLRDSIKKIYPVRICQIKSIYIEKEKKHEEEDEVKVKEVVEKTLDKKKSEEIKVEESPAKEKTVEKAKSEETKEEKIETEGKVIEKEQKEEKTVEEIKSEEIKKEVEKEVIPNAHDLAKKKEEKAEDKK